MEHKMADLNLIGVSKMAEGSSSDVVLRKAKTNGSALHVMRFNKSLNFDITKLKQARLERENNYKDYKIEDGNPKYGAGSEFGREQREESRRKKHGIITKQYNTEDQPWILKSFGNMNKKYRGIREGGVTENAAFFAISQTPDGAFEATPVEEWYNFSPVQCFKTLSAEEAEEEFGRRDKVYNFFSIMVKKKLQNDPNEDDDEIDKKTGSKKKKKKKKNKDFKISDMDDSWVNELEIESGDSDAESDEDKPSKKSSKGGKKKRKKNADKSDDEAREESDEGDFDDKEVDYITSSSGSEEEVEEDEKANRELKGVEDEEALRKLDEQEADEAEENGEEAAKESEGTPEAKEKSGEQKPKAKQKQSDSSGESSSDSSDSDFDDPKFTSAIFVAQNIQKSKKKSGSDNSTGSSRANTPTKLQSERDGQKAQKRKVPDLPGPSIKKVKMESENSRISSSSTLDGINEETVRRYLQRKPMTASELLHKFKSKKTKMNSEQLVTKIADVLKRMDLQKTNIKGKLYLSLKSS